MNCPVCKTIVLEASPLEENLIASTCAQCGGHWLASTDYENWLALPSSAAEVELTDTSPIEVTDTPQAKLCPQCKRILTRYKVGHDLHFILDHCSGCNGMWLDSGEWDNLKASNLHRSLQRVPTAPWQREVRHSEHKKTMQAFYAERFGENDYAEIQRVHAWLLEHPQREMMLAYLAAADPYQAK